MIEHAPLPTLETDRLILRAWQDSDIAPFAALNADPEVMRFFPAPLDEADSRKIITSFADRHVRTGLSPHAVQVKETGAFIGFVGLSRVAFDAWVKDEVEIGWRLSRASWGQGYAREAARAVLNHGLTDQGLSRIVAFAPTINRPSIAVMRSVGMSRVEDGDFIHPALDRESPLQPLEVWSIARGSADRSVPQE